MQPSSDLGNKRYDILCIEKETSLGSALFSATSAFCHLLNLARWLEFSGLILSNLLLGAWLLLGQSCFKSTSNRIHHWIVLPPWGIEAVEFGYYLLT